MGAKPGQSCKCGGGQLGGKDVYAAACCGKGGNAGSAKRQSGLHAHHFSIGKGKHKLDIGKAVSTAEKTVGKDVTTAAKAVEKVAAAVVNEAVKVLKTVGEDVAFAPLLPFKAAMKADLQKHDITTDNTMLDIVSKLVVAMKDGKLNFDGYSFDSYHVDDPNAPPAWMDAIAGVVSGVVGIPAAVLSGIIWGFIHKKVKTPGTDYAAGAAAAAAAAKADLAKNSVSDTVNVFGHKFTVGAFASKGAMAVIGIIAVVLIIRHFVHKKKPA